MAGKIYPELLELASSLLNGVCPITFFRRFLDDIFFVYTGSVESLHRFLSELNNIHPTIKLTMTQTLLYQKENSEHRNIRHEKSNRCTCKPDHNLAFLDTSCKIVDGKIIVDLFKKETDRNQYLLTS